MNVDKNLPRSQYVFVCQATEGREEKRNFLFFRVPLLVIEKYFCMNKEKELR
jgi:hypothetical protein